MARNPDGAGTAGVDTVESMVLGQIGYPYVNIIYNVQCTRSSRTAGTVSKSSSNH
jgi:hypothetical protein